MVLAPEQSLEMEQAYPGLLAHTSLRGRVRTDEALDVLIGAIENVGRVNPAEAHIGLLPDEEVVNQAMSRRYGEDEEEQHEAMEGGGYEGYDEEEAMGPL